LLYFSETVKLSHKILGIIHVRSFVLLSTKLMKLCCFKIDNPTAFTLLKIVSTNNREESVVLLELRIKHF